MRQPRPADPWRPEAEVVDEGEVRLVAVAHRRALAQPLVVLTAGIILVAAAVWKPWQGPTTAEPSPSQAPAAVVATPTERPPSDVQIAESDIRLSAPGASLPRLYGLNLSYMGESDPHRDWGVVVAYVPRVLVTAALKSGATSVSPSVDWESIDPPVRAPGPTLDDTGLVSVAIAATWPSDVEAVDVSLLYFGGPAAGGDAQATDPHGRSMPLSRPVPILAHIVAATDGLHLSTAFVPWPRLPGTFFFPPAPAATSLVGWLSGGWPAGQYEYVITDSEGSVTALPFTLVGAAGPG